MNINDVMNKMTVEEKCALLVGKDVWRTKDFEKLGIPSLITSDGPHGLRKVIGDGPLTEKAIKGVCYPSLVTLASSFDPEMAFKMGKSIATEFKAENVNVILGPGLNIKRHPYCGRNFEYFSEDPLLTTKMGAGFVKGAKTENIGTCIKHYALNSQESYRMISDSIVDERAKYEIYYRAFKEILELEPEMVMCSYNKVDGIYASENYNLLKEVLRDEFGFKGVIVSDWTAVNDRTKALFATLDLEMPGHIFGVHKLIDDYKKGLIPLEKIDNSVKKILTLVKQFEGQKNPKVDLGKNHQISKEIARNSFVLLKNDDNLLPLKKSDKVLLVGEMADYVRYQGGGSSHINAHKVDSIKECLDVEYVKGYRSRNTITDLDLLNEALNKAEDKDKVLIVCGLTPEFESEGYDRTHLSIPANQIELIEALSKVNKNIILILQMGSPIEMPFLKNVKSILNIYLAGETIGQAVKDTLYGETNPSGRLAETFPLSEEYIPSNVHFAKGNAEVHYQESIFVGYRYYNTFDVPVLFPFGYGLSYTKFNYSNLKLSKKSIQSDNGTLTLSVDITNTGSVFGKEVVMLFFEAMTSKTPRAKRELIDFQKIGIKPNETKTVTFKIELRMLSYFNIEKHEYFTEDGIYNLQICKDVNTVILEEKFDVKRNIKDLDTVWHNLNTYTSDAKERFSDEEFEKILGRNKGPEHIKYKRPFNINNNFEDIEHTLIGKIMLKKINKELDKALKNQNEDFILMITKNLKQQPLRSIVLNSGGKISVNMMMFLIEIINFRFLKALKYLFRKD